MIEDPTSNAAAEPAGTAGEEVQTRSNTIVRPTDHQMPLELRGVTIRYEGGGADPLTIVEDFNLGLEAGTMHCLAGRSGSGKTSILTVAAGLTMPTAGDVLWEGESLDSMDDDEISDRRRALIGYVDQGGALIDGMSALENVLLPAVPDGQVAARTEMAKNLLGLVGLGRRMHHRPAQLSGGERQRVAIARALILGTKVLVVDEPTASLDREHANQIIGILKDTTRDGITVLVATHDQELIDVADSRTYMN